MNKVDRNKKGYLTVKLPHIREIHFRAMNAEGFVT